MSRKRGKRKQPQRKNIPNKLVQLLSPHVPTFQQHLEQTRTVMVHLRGKPINIDRWFLDHDKTQQDPLFDESIHARKLGLLPGRA